MRIAQVAHLTESVPPKLYGGSERIIAYLTDELVHSGHDVTLFASADSVTTARLEAVCGEAVRNPDRESERMVRLALLQERVLQLSAQYDIIHAHLDFLAFPLARRSKTPIVIGWLRLRGQELGFYDLGFGLALFAAFTTLLGTIFLWRFASSLNRADMQRTRSEHHVRRLLWQAEEREQALRDKQAQLVQAAKLASIGELATGIAHEVNNPLNNIGLFVSNALECLRAGKPADVIVPGLEAALKQVERAAGIVAGIRSFGRTAPTDFKVVNANDAIRNALALISEQLKLRHIQIQLDLPVDPVLIQGNQAQLEQVFLNLFINAGDAMEGAAERILSIATDVSSSILVIIVRDTGCGIPDHALEQIFDPFFTTKPVGQGTGLGLSITYRIVKEHGGDIRVHQEPRGGASFIISLPTCLEPAPRRLSPEQERHLSHSSR